MNEEDDTSTFAATHAHASLSETLGVMMARVTTTRVPLTTNKLGADAIASDPALAATLRRALDDLSAATSRQD